MPKRVASLFRRQKFCYDKSNIPGRRPALCPPGVLGGTFYVNNQTGRGSRQRPSQSRRNPAHYFFRPRRSRGTAEHRGRLGALLTGNGGLPARRAEQRHGRIRDPRRSRDDSHVRCLADRRHSGGALLLQGAAAQTVHDRGDRPDGLPACQRSRAGVSRGIRSDLRRVPAGVPAAGLCGLGAERARRSRRPGGGCLCRSRFPGPAGRFRRNRPSGGARSVRSGGFRPVRPQSSPRCGLRSGSAGIRCFPASR